MSDDTIQYYYERDDGSPFYFTYPINSNVSFKANPENHILHSSSAEISNDSLIIYLTKQSFGLIIDLKIYVVKDKPTATISYWTALGDETRRLKSERVIITFKNKDLKNGDKLIARLNIEFTGKVADPDPAVMRDRKIMGKIEGCVNVQINKILKSRLD
jgi:hypothetical protein